MTIRKLYSAVALGTAVSAVALVSGCKQGALKNEQAEELKEHEVLEVLHAFDDDTAPHSIGFTNASGKLVDDGSGKSNALVVNFDSKDNTYADVHISPSTPYDWSEYDDFSVAFDISNQGETSVHVYLDMTDKNGSNYTRAVAIPRSALADEKTFYGKMRGHDLGTPEGDINVELNFESGLRSNPPTWEGYDDKQFVSLWGNKNLDIRGIASIRFSVQSAMHDKEITIDNIRLIKNPPKDPNFLVGIVDEFGQNAKLDFADKVSSVEELIAQRDKEAAELQNGKKMPDRSEFSGWADGPQLEATGYFRTEKVGDTWALVTPEGHLFWSSGIANIRLANTTTLTGYDFDQKFIKQREPGDLTPEDSVGMNRASEQAQKTRYVTSEERAKMFVNLPDYDSPMGVHYGYRREAHSGPLDRGEVYSFYRANLDRKYGHEGDIEKSWAKKTVDRFLSWGFTSTGNWVDPMFYQVNRIPYFANGWVIGDFKTVSSGNDFWRALPDVFDPKFAERADITVSQVAAEVKGNPWCVGVFIDNEMSFGRSETVESRLGIPIHTLQRDGADVPTKAKFTSMMKAKYGSIDKLNKAWDKSIASWTEFDKGFDSALNTEVQTDDYRAMLHEYASQYFRTVRDAVKRHMPNHMYLGSRFPDWGMPLPVVKAAAKYADVVSYNSYKQGLTKKTWAFLEEIDRPSIIGEFHFGAQDSGLYHPGLIHAESQEDRGKMFKDYMNSALENPYFIGAHWFQYLDSPITGRAHDGENYNVGFVQTTDIPYEPLVRASREFHSDLYERRFGDAVE